VYAQTLRILGVRRVKAHPSDPEEAQQPDAPARVAAWQTRRWHAPSLARRVGMRATGARVTEFPPVAL
jgi:hypothetical protein